MTWIMTWHPKIQKNVHLSFLHPKIQFWMKLDKLNIFLFLLPYNAPPFPGGATNDGIRMKFSLLWGCRKCVKWLTTTRNHLCIYVSMYDLQSLEGWGRSISSQVSLWRAGYDRSYCRLQARKQNYVTNDWMRIKHHINKNIDFGKAYATVYIKSIWEYTVYMF